jgi:hypothetical protein
VDDYFYPLLSCVSGEPPGPLKVDLPSWVPDLSYAPKYYKSWSAYSAFDASHGATRVSRFSGSTRDILHIKALTIDTIAFISPFGEAENSWSGWCNFFTNCQRKLASLETYPTGESLADVWWRVLCGDLYNDGPILANASEGFSAEDYLNPSIASPCWENQQRFSQIRKFIKGNYGT